MNIKSLLLGSAAALVAVSGARAADAVVMVEPEPAEYVRICDTYGTGFFYIPGTETCLKVGGYVRVRINARDNTTNNDVDLDNLNAFNGPAGVFSVPDVNAAGLANGDLVDVDGLDNGLFDNGGVSNIGGIFTRGLGNDDYNVGTAVRARVEFDAREETELGMLRSFIRLQATNSADTAAGVGTTGNDTVAIDQAYIQLGGLTMGKLDSLWAERDGLFTDNDWSVGDLSNNRISYTFAVAGFTAAVSVEDDGSGDFVPDVVGQLAYEGGWGEAYVSGVYDEQSNSGGLRTFDTNATDSAVFARPAYSNLFVFDDPRDNIFNPQFVQFFNGDLNDNDDGAFALKAGVTLKDLLVAGSQFKVEGSYAFDPTVYTGDTGGNYLAPGGTIGTSGIFQSATAGSLPVVIDTSVQQSYNLSSEWQIGAGYQQQFGELFASVSGVYGETFDLKRFVNNAARDGITTFNLGNAEYYGVAANVGYNITSNFSVLGEVSYRDIDLPSGISAGNLDTTAGFIEFKRTF